MSKSISLKDVAKAAGVSPSTVSRALSRHPRISAKTGDRIRGLAQEMGYTPSLPARSLVTRDTATIGMAITQASDPFLGQLVAGVEEAAQSNGYSVFLSSSYRDAVREEEVIRSFYERRATGVIVTGSQIAAGYTQLRERFPLPIVLINFPEYPYSVSTDNQAGARQVVKHLLHFGHRRIAYIGNRHSYNTNFNRLAGYKSALAQHEIPLDEQLLGEGDGTLPGGIEAASRLLSLPQPPTAIFCFNDMTAMGVLYALERAGVQVPNDCSVAGFDDLDLAAYLRPPLTTVRQPCYQLGQHAMHMLLKLIRGQDNIRPEILPAELVMRESTGPVPASPQGRG